MFTDDPVADFERRDRQEAAWLRSKPVCVRCKEHIQDETYLNIHGDTYHIECGVEAFEVQNEEFEI